MSTRFLQWTACKCLTTEKVVVIILKLEQYHLSQLMRLWYLSHRRTAKAQASLRIHAVLPEPSLFAHMKYGNRRRVWPKHQTSSPTGWQRMHVWRMSVRRKKSAIISWAGSFYYSVMGPKDEDGMAKSVDPDQTFPLGAVWSGSILFAQTCLSKNLRSLQ